MNVPDAAIEAAAEALWGDFEDGEGEYPNFSDYAKKEQDYWRHDARVAIEAAMPAIREHIAQEIERQRVPYTLQETAGRCWALGQQDAARIVRGGAA